MSKLPLIERLPSDVVESDDWLSNAFPIVEEDNGALSPFDLADIFPQPVETIPNTNSNNSDSFSFSSNDDEDVVREARVSFGGSSSSHYHSRDNSDCNEEDDY